MHEFSKLFLSDTFHFSSTISVMEYIYSTMSLCPDQIAHMSGNLPLVRIFKRPLFLFSNISTIFSVEATANQRAVPPLCFEVSSPEFTSWSPVFPQSKCALLKLQCVEQYLLYVWCSCLSPLDIFSELFQQHASHLVTRHCAEEHISSCNLFVVPLHTYTKRNTKYITSSKPSEASTSKGLYGPSFLYDAHFGPAETKLSLKYCCPRASI